MGECTYNMIYIWPKEVEYFMYFPQIYPRGFTTAQFALQLQSRRKLGTNLTLFLPRVTIGTFAVDSLIKRRKSWKWFLVSFSLTVYVKTFVKAQIEMSIRSQQKDNYRWNINVLYINWFRSDSFGKQHWFQLEVGQQSIPQFDKVLPGWETEYLMLYI